MIKTGICLFGMNPVGRGNNDRIEVFLAVKKLLIILVNMRRLAIFF